MKLEDALKSGKFSSAKQQAGLNIMYSAWWLKTLISSELKVFGLTHEQYNVLRILKGKHPEKMCVKDIGSRMIERSSNVPRIIDRLVAKEFVDRFNSEADKRETVINLTEKGIDVLKTANQKVEAVFADMVLLDEQEAIQLNSLLENLRQKE